MEWPIAPVRLGFSATTVNCIDRATFTRARTMPHVSILRSLMFATANLASQVSHIRVCRISNSTFDSLESFIGNDNRYAMICKCRWINCMRLAVYRSRLCEDAMVLNVSCQNLLICVLKRKVYSLCESGLMTSINKTVIVNNRKTMARNFIPVWDNSKNYIPAWGNSMNYILSCMKL